MWGKSRKVYIVDDPVVGWRGRPNYVGSLPDYPKVPVRLDGLGWRLLSGQETSGTAKRIHMYGCSYTFGAGVDVAHTFAHRLQRDFEDMKFESRALPGYGTIQSLLHLQRDLRSTTSPDLAVFCFLDVHTRRNVASPIFLRNLHGRYWTRRDSNIKIPRAGLDSGGKLMVKLIEPFPKALSKSSIMQYEIDTYYRNLITIEILRTAEKEVARFGKRLAVVILRQDGEYQEFNQKLKEMLDPSTSFADVSFERGSHLDLSRQDRHPNEEGHALYADRLKEFIKSIYHKI